MLGGCGAEVEQGADLAPAQPLPHSVCLTGGLARPSASWPPDGAAHAAEGGGSSAAPCSIVLVCLCAPHVILILHVLFHPSSMLPDIILCQRTAAASAADGDANTQRMYAE
jgi:hypothetical protein